MASAGPSEQLRGIRAGLHQEYRPTARFVPAALGTFAQGACQQAGLGFEISFCSKALREGS